MRARGWPSLPSGDVAILTLEDALKMFFIGLVLMTFIHAWTGMQVFKDD